MKIKNVASEKEINLINNVGYIFMNSRGGFYVIIFVVVIFMMLNAALINLLISVHLEVENPMLITQIGLFVAAIYTGLWSLAKCISVIKGKK